MKFDAKITIFFQIYKALRVFLRNIIYHRSPLVQRPSSARSDAFFRSFRGLLPGYRYCPNVVKVPWQQGIRAFRSTVCVSPNNRLRLRKRPFAYTQKLSSAYFQGHCWGGVEAPFLANIAPKNLFIINKIT